MSPNEQTIRTLYSLAEAKTKDSYNTFFAQLFGCDFSCVRSEAPRDRPALSMRRDRMPRQS
jgi:hypothetical protein